MKIEVNIRKKYFFTLVALVLVFSATMAVFAYTKLLANAPDPGHRLNEIGAYFSGDATLDQSLDKFCQADGTNCPTVPTPPAANYCNAYNTTVADNGKYVTISLIKNGRNICADENGCSYRITSNTAGGPIDYVKNYPVLFTQFSNNIWLDSAGNQIGINGDGTEKTFNLGWASAELLDDHPSGTAPTENSVDALTFRDNNNARGFSIVICDY